MAREHLLVVEDDDNLRAMLGAALAHHGFEISLADNGQAALDSVRDRSPDFIVLDVMMPGIDGFEVCRRLRASNDQTPVLFLTARDKTEDKIRGLRLGGDDYLEKPFSLEELIARVGAILRRAAAGASRPIQADQLALEDVAMDDEGHIVRKAGNAVHLSPTEYKLLRYLLVNQGIVLSKAQILDHVWDYDYDGDLAVVETYIRYLRRKLDTTEPKLIHTIRGIGYTMRVQP